MFESLLLLAVGLAAPAAAIPAADVERSLRGGCDALRAGDFAEAARLFEEAVREEPETARGWILLARSRCLEAEAVAASEADDAEARAQERIGQAEEAARAALERDRHDPEVWATLGHVLVRSGRFNEAIDSLYHAERLGEPTPELLLDLSDALLTAREFELENGDDGSAAARLADAQAALARADALLAGHVQVARRRGEIHAAKGEPLQAARAYRRALQLAPDRSDLHEAHLKAVEAAQAFDDAREFLTGLVDEPALARWYRSRVNELHGHVEFNKVKDYVAAARRYQDAERDFREAAAADPALEPAVEAWIPSLRAFRGRALTLAGQFAEAEAALLGALDLDRAHADALAFLQQLQDAMWQKYGGESMSKEQWDEMRGFASKMAMVEPQRAAHWNNWAFFAREAGKYEESFQAYKRALELEPDNPTYLNDAALILLYHLGRDKDRAEAWLRRAIEEAEQVLQGEARTTAEKASAQTALGDAFGNLINVFQQSERKEQAIELLRELERKLPRRSEVAYWKERLLPEEWQAEQEAKQAAAAGDDGAAAGGDDAAGADADSDAKADDGEEE